MFFELSCTCLFLIAVGQGFRLGITLMNMGPDVYYADKEMVDPIPFTLNLALGYKKAVISEDEHVFDFAGELRFDKELVVNHFSGNPDPFWKALFTEWGDEPFNEELKDFNIHEGFEFGYRRTVFFRQGFLLDFTGGRYELDLGAGLNLFNHLKWNFAYIVAPEGFMKGLDPENYGSNGVRDGQWRFTVAYTGFGSWSDGDLRWWKE